MRKALLKTFWLATIPGAIFMMLWTALQIFGFRCWQSISLISCSPYFLLNRLIRYFTSDQPKWHGTVSPPPTTSCSPGILGILYAVGILINQALGTTLGNQMFFHAARVGVRARCGTLRCSLRAYSLSGAVCSVIFRKAMRISSVKSVGEVVNLYGCAIRTFAPR